MTSKEKVWSTSEQKLVEVEIEGSREEYKTCVQLRPLMKLAARFNCEISDDFRGTKNVYIFEGSWDDLERLERRLLEDHHVKTYGIKNRLIIQNEY